MKFLSQFGIFVLVAGCGGSSDVAAVDHSAGHVVSLEVSPVLPSLRTGETIQLRATATYDDGSTADVTSTVSWFIEEPDVATISSTGLVLGISVGTTRIDLNAKNGVATGTFVTVLGPYTRTILHEFGPPPDGRQPSSLIRGTDGDFYGTTSIGGPNTCNHPNFCGTLFKITSQGEKTTLYEFDSGLIGSHPESPLLEASDGNFYGTLTSGGVTGGGGTIFKMTPDGTVTALHSFGVVPEDGYNPSGGLLEASDGNFYGVTNQGGGNYCPQGQFTCGTVYRMRPDGTYTTLYAFGVTPDDGIAPVGELIEASDGYFYGVTNSGGPNQCGSFANTCGTVFKITPEGAVTIVHAFGATPIDGAAPGGTLIQTGDGNIYGTTVAGGEYFHGTFFRIAPDGTYRVLHSFGHTNSDGRGPDGPLTIGNDGNFYGVTRSGGYSLGAAGVEGNGTVFMITPEGAEKVLYAFGADGGYDPVGQLIQTSDGSLYGVTTFHPTIQIGGTVYKLQP